MFLLDWATRPHTCFCGKGAPWCNVIAVAEKHIICANGELKGLFLHKSYHLNRIMKIE